MQCIISQVGGSSDLMRGDSHQQLLVVSPGEQQTASRQAQDTVLVHAGLQRQHLQLLLTNTQEHVVVDDPRTSQTTVSSSHQSVRSLTQVLADHLDSIQSLLTLAVSSSCSSSSRLEGFSETETHVR